MGFMFVVILFCIAAAVKYPKLVVRPGGVLEVMQERDFPSNFVGHPGIDGPTGPIGPSAILDPDLEQYYSSFSVLERPPASSYFYEPRTIAIPLNISWVVKFKTKKLCSRDMRIFNTCGVEDVRGFDTEKKATEFFSKKGKDAILKIKL
jgi:hypothetical protein